MPHDPISLTEHPNLPAAFSSRAHVGGDRGRILASDEFYLVFEHRPLPLEEFMTGQQVGPYPTEYLYGLSVFYRNSRNPHARRKLPILAICLAYNDLICPKKPQGLWASLSGAPEEPGRVFPIVFSSRGQMNIFSVVNDFTDETAKAYLVERACAHLGIPTNSSRDVGPLSLGSECPEVA